MSGGDGTCVCWGGGLCHDAFFPLTCPSFFAGEALSCKNTIRWGSEVWEGGTHGLHGHCAAKTVLCTGQWRGVWVQLLILLLNLWSLAASSLGSYPLDRDDGAAALA